MDTAKIRAIFKAIECKSMSKAAQALSYTPSAMSHMADALEGELGVRILKRTPFGVEWSEEGRKLEPMLRKLLDDEAELKASAEALSMQGEHVLRIGTYSSISVHLLPELLKGFKAECPGVQVSITIGDSLKDWLSTDKVDVIFDDMGKRRYNEWIPIMKDPYYAVLPNSVLPAQKVVRRDQLCSYPFIEVQDSHTQKYFEGYKFAETIKFASVDDTSVLSMVKEGIGISVLPALVLKKHSKGIHTARLEPELYRSLGISYKTNAAHSYGVEKFIQYLKKTYKQVK